MTLSEEWPIFARQHNSKHHKEYSLAADVSTLGSGNRPGFNGGPFIGLCLYGLSKLPYESKGGVAKVC